MRIWNVMHSFPASGAILWLASWFVPGKKRTEWLAEWRSELWHVCQICHQRRNEHEVTNFCLGAFKDALWMRREYIQSTSRRVYEAGSPLRCEFTLAALATASLLVAVALPGVSKILAPSPYVESDDLVMISPSGNSSAPAATVQLADYQDWSHSAHHLFTEFAFYQPRQGRVHIANHLSAELSIARASNNTRFALGYPMIPLRKSESINRRPRAGVDSEPRGLEPIFPSRPNSLWSDSRDRRRAGRHRRRCFRE